MNTVLPFVARSGPQCSPGCAIIMAFTVLLGSLLPEVVSAQKPPSNSASTVTFQQVPAAESGITWVHENAMSDERHLPETVGAGCAFFDYDNDGWMDIYLVNSGPSDFYKPKSELRNALYHNNRDGTFTDVTKTAGVAGGQFGMGVAAADYDGDGDKDLYVTSYGRNLLYRNDGDGRFTEVAEEAGLDIAGWFTHAVWFDYDNDSDLDLFVSSFVSYSLEEAKYCGDNSIGRRHYCIPRSFKPTKSRLFQNDVGGKFIDVSKESGITSVEGKAFGAVATDINNDGHLDLFVANDTVPNFLFVNQGDGTFEEEGLLLGVAYSDSGNARSGMGVDATDYDGDGWQDLFVANIDQEMFSLYRNLEGADFQDASLEVRRATRLLSGWGLKFFDYDNDGDPDLILSNGHPDDMIDLFKPLVSYKEPLVLLENLGHDFKNVSARSGEGLPEEVLLARPRDRRLRQRWRLGRAGVEQWRTPSAAAERRGEREQLDWTAAQGHGEQSGRHRRNHQLGIQRHKTSSFEDRWRKLSRVARSAGDSRNWRFLNCRFDRNSMAEWQSRSTEVRARGQLCRFSRNGRASAPR